MTEQVVKKEWAEPELIVLVRSNPEEAVLVICKTSGNFENPIAKNLGCDYTDCGAGCDFPGPS